MATGTKDLGHGRTRIHLNAFDAAAPTHMSPGQWKNPADKGLTKRSLSYWINIAKLLERGGFTAYFLADTTGGYDTYGNSEDYSVKRGASYPVLDPFVPVTAMASVTKNLVFAITGSTAGESPFVFARRIATLDHLTDGRIAWNIVTSFKTTAFKALGMENPPPHDERYAQADEFCRVLYKFWEGSWADDALKLDAENDILTDPAHVRVINHKGKYFRTETRFIVEPSPQRTPFLFQAGTSPAGMNFSSTHAEGIFLGGFSPTATAPKVAAIRQAAAEKGRDPRSIKFFAMVVVIVGPTDEQAQEKLKELKKYASVEGGLCHVSGITGIDFSSLPLDQELKESDSVSAHKVYSQMAALTTEAEKKWTPRMVSEQAAIGGLAPLFIGSPTTVADTMEEWIRVADIDGFTIVHGTTPGSFEDIVEYLVPELRKRGVYPESTEPGLTARETMHGQGQNNLPEDHVGRTYKYSTYKEDPPYEQDAIGEEMNDSSRQGSKRSRRC